MYVGGGVQERGHFLQDGQGTTRGLGCRSDDHGGLTKDKPFPTVAGDGERRHWRRCHGGNLRPPNPCREADQVYTCLLPVVSAEQS